MEESDIDWKDPCELGICDYGCKHEVGSEEGKKGYAEVVTIVLSGIENQRYKIKMGNDPEAKAGRLFEFYCRIMHVDPKDYDFKVRGKIIDPKTLMGLVELGPCDMIVGYKKMK